MSAAEPELDPALPSFDDDAGFLDALRRGDEAAFGALVNRHQRAMLAVASLFLSSIAVAEEVVQDTWLAFLDGLDRFEGRSSLRTWIFAILVNRARSRARLEARTLPLSAIVRQELSSEATAVDSDLFTDDPSSWRGHWASDPRPWDGDLGQRLVAAETTALIEGAIDTLPPVQRAVILLRDVQGWSAREVASALKLTTGNQRVVLHRARVRVREAIRWYLDGD